jgi:hypothetical protein
MPSENYNLSLFCQLAGYSFDFSLRAKATLPFLRFIPNSILDFLFRFIGVAMVFQESSSSGQLIIKKINEDLMIHADASRRLTISEHNKYKSLIKSLKKIGVLPLKLFIRSVGIGESYHLGNLKKHNGEKIFEVSGKVCGTLNIYVVDSSSLPYLAPGPITLTAMANSYRITKDSI